MRRLFLCSFITAFTIVGSVIGAGFITGKEVYEFFSVDLSLSGIYLAFICFSLTIYLVMSFKLDKGVERYLEIFVSLANLIIAGCMISALDSVYQRLFCLTKKVKIFSVLTAILLFFMTLKNISVTEKLCSILLPIVIIIIVVLCLCKIDDYSARISPTSRLGIVNPLIYVGFNVILSSSVIKNSGEKLSPPFKMLSSLITSAMLCTCIFLLALAVKSNGKIYDMPFISLFLANKKLLIIIDIITLFAIFSTLASAYFTINSFGKINVGIKCKLALFLLTVLISEIGFSIIVERLYFAVGILSYVVIAVSCLLSKAFQQEQRGRTYPLQARIK